MNKLFFILICAVTLLYGCEDKDDSFPEKPWGVTLSFTPVHNMAALDDPDDLPDEYEIKDLSIFVASAGTNLITEKFIHHEFSSVDNTYNKLVNLPLEQAGTMKDIYVVANCPDITALNAIQSVDDLKLLKTPVVENSSGLTTIQGLPMYGQIVNANLSGTTSENPANIMLNRTCAKIRISLLFPDNSWLGIANSFMIENLAPYTFYISNNSFRFDPSELIAYPQINFEQVNAQEYHGVIYIYESQQLPLLHIYTTINDSEKEYIIGSSFPLPLRNYYYDIQIQALPSANPLVLRTVTSNQAENFKINVRSYKLF